MLEFIIKILALFRRQKINLADYPIRMDYGTMNEWQRKAFDNILMACEVGGAEAAPKQPTLFGGEE